MRSAIFRPRARVMVRIRVNVRVIVSVKVRMADRKQRLSSITVRPLDGK